MNNQVKQYISFLMALVFYFAYLQAKPNTQKVNNGKKIIWINEISSSTINAPDKSLFESLKDIIFGSVEIRLSKPFSVYVKDLQNILIFDQENGGIINIAETKKGYSIKKVIDAGKFPSLISAAYFERNKLLFTDSQKKKSIVLIWIKSKLFRLMTVCS